MSKQKRLLYQSNNTQKRYYENIVKDWERKNKHKIILNLIIKLNLSKQISKVLISILIIIKCIYKIFGLFIKKW